MAGPGSILRGVTALALLVVLGPAGCASQRGASVLDVPASQKSPSTALAPAATADTRLARATTPLEASHPGLSGFYLLSDGVDALAARLLLALRAERSIDLQYYLLHSDVTGLVFVEQVLAAADRGVRVRMLLDDMTTVGYDRALAALEGHPHIEIRIFNPFSRRSGRFLDFATDFERVTHRMHNKSMTFDNQVTIVGGRNIGDEYFEARHDLNYNDLDFLAVGPVVVEVSGSFDAYWNSRAAVPVSALVDEPEDPEALERFRAQLRARTDEARASVYREAFDKSLADLEDFRADNLQWVEWKLASDPPDKAGPDFEERRAEQLSAQLRPAVDAATKEFILISPYFVPGERGEALFRALRERGLRVVIVTNSLRSNDVKPVHAGYSKSRKALLEMGVELWEVREDKDRGRVRRNLGHSASSLHTKAFVVDRSRLFVGSFNFDPRSVDLNTEMGILVDSSALAESAADAVERALPGRAYRLSLDDDGDIVWTSWEDGREVVYRSEPRTGLWERFTIGVLRLLPIDEQL